MKSESYNTCWAGGAQEAGLWLLRFIKKDSVSKG